MLLLLLEAAAALALVEYVRRELPALGAGATDARRAARHRDTCELTATTGQHHRSSLAPFFFIPHPPVHLRSQAPKTHRANTHRLNARRLKTRWLNTYRRNTHRLNARRLSAHKLNAHKPNAYRFRTTKIG